jgi:diguanylate cyclase (GGDEF)-like protein/PAS domain S-box-containing protein
VKFSVIAITVGAALSVLALQWLLPGHGVRMVFPLLMASVSLTAGALVAREHVRAAIYVLVYGAWSAVTVTVLFTGGLQAPMMMIYPGLIVLIGLMTRRRHALSLCALTAAVTLALAWIETDQLLPQAYPSTPYAQAVDQIVVYLVFMLISLALMQAFRGRLRELRALSRNLSHRSAVLESSQAELNRAQSVATVGSWVGDMASDTMRASDEMMRIFGLAQGSRMSFADYKSFVHPDDRVAVDLAWRAALKGAPFDEEHRVLVNGSVRWIRQKAELVYSEEGRAIRAEGIAQDITERKETERALMDSEARYRTLVELTPQPVLVHRDGVLVYVNEAAVALFGAPDAAALMQKTTKDLIHTDSQAAQTERMKLINAHGGVSSTTQARFLKWDGAVFDVQVQGTAIVYEGQPAIQVAIHDVSELKSQQAALARMAHFDMLTGLPNRVLLADRLQQAMAHAKRYRQRLAVVFLDLDGFKAVNDRHGHDAGDHLLVTVARRMKQALREGDSLARMGGDEFVAVLLDLEENSPLFARLLAAVAEPVEFEGFELAVSASLGVAFYPQADEVDADQLLRQADQAMYQVKLKGKNGFVVFDAEQDRSVRGQHEELARLRRALVEREFVLHYQPKVNLRTGAVVGAEALIRWQHPEKGLRPPADFLPLMEDHPLAVEVGEWVLDTALRDQAAWRAVGLDIQVSVNVGGFQLQRPDFVARLSTILARHPALQPGALELEVLETSALGELAHVSQVIQDCRAMGVSTALDDFGTGYSSLTYLKRLPVTTLKIDRSFVRDMLEDPDDLAILEGVLSLARAFHREVVAEGVETREHGALLLQLGCELVQGFGIARPMPSNQMQPWCDAWQAAPVWSEPGPVLAVAG